MNKEEIIRMAREADSYADKHGPSAWRHPDEFAAFRDEHFAALVAKHTLANIDPSSFMSWQEGFAAGAAAEREACAKVCEEPGWNAANWCAKQIRARGDKT